MNSAELSQIIADILYEKKADDISVLPVAQKTTLTEYFVLASATTPNHAKALEDELSYRLKSQYDLSPLAVEGRETGRWILLDYAAVVVHLMCKQDRDFYDLDKFWAKKEGENLSPEDQSSQIGSEEQASL
ncbi:MAG: ribosome silencing factor [Eubacteriales bacterium]|nr:ribosome silencing factor [Eubacteriales bacterium]